VDIDCGFPMLVPQLFSLEFHCFQKLVARHHKGSLCLAFNKTNPIKAAPKSDPVTLCRGVGITEPDKPPCSSVAASVAGAEKRINNPITRQ